MKLRQLVIRTGKLLPGRPLRLLALAAFAALLALPVGAVSAQEVSPIRVLSSSAVSEFPSGMRFALQVESSAGDIVSIAVRMHVGLRTSGVYEYMEYEPGPSVEASLFWRTDTGARYIPPSTFITYTFEIEDSAGNTLVTEPAVFPYHDARFEWTEITSGPVTVSYHGPVATRAQAVLDVIVQTLDKMGPVLGSETLTPIRTAMYNNVAEMLPALPPGSSTVRTELITEGQAFSDVGTLLVLGSGSLALGTASHEATHILTHRAGDSVFRRIPSWLDEGLAEYGNVAPGFSYDIALEFAIATGRLMPIVFTQTLPGVPEDVIIYYGQSRSIVRFMINTYGTDKMQELMAALKEGADMDAALTRVYGVDRLALYNLWLRSVNADPYELPAEGSVRPTPIPRPTVGMFSLTPQADSITVGSASDTGNQPSEGGSSVEPQSTPGASLSDLATRVVSDTGQPQEPQASPGGCSAPASAGTPEVSMSVLLLGIAGLVLRRAIGRRR